MGIPAKVVKRDEGLEAACRANSDNYKHLRDEYLRGKFRFHGMEGVKGIE
jgi:hypothetical protein